MKIGFYKGKDTFFSKLITWWTRGPYSHCELIFNMDDTHKFSGSSQIGEGVRLKHEAYNKEQWVFLDVPDSLASSMEAYRWFYENQGKDYDLMGVFGLVIRRVSQDRNKYFCSEAIGEAVGIVDPWRYDPNAFYSLIESLNRHPL